MDWLQLGAFISVVASSCALIIKQLENSRCTKINLCCLKCDRHVPPSMPDKTGEPEEGF